MHSPLSLVSVATVAALLIAACSGPEVDETSATDAGKGSPSTAASTSVATPRNLNEVALPVADGADVDGLVNGARARSRRSLHGVREPDRGGPARLDRSAGRHVPRLLRAADRELKPDFRVCSYDRANVGDSETVAGTQTRKWSSATSTD